MSAEVPNRTGKLLVIASGNQISLLVDGAAVITGADPLALVMAILAAAPGTGGKLARVRAAVAGVGA